jgi:hypothetical protein
MIYTTTELFTTTELKDILWKYFLMGGERVTLITVVVITRLTFIGSLRGLRLASDGFVPFELIPEKSTGFFTKKA